MQEELLEQSINKIKQGVSLAEAVFAVSDGQKPDLENMLLAARMLAALPKNQPPKPVLQRKYALLAQKRPKLFLSFLHLSRFSAASLGSAFLLAALILGGLKASASLPGQPLFAIKRTAENVRLKFVMDEAAKAQLQLEFAQNRLNEAQVILSNPSSNKQQEIAALNELASQTKTAADSVQQLAASQPLEQNNHPIVSRLATLAQQQNSVIDKAQSGDEGVKAAAQSAANVSNTAAAQASQIKKYLAIAQAAQDPIALVDLSADPDAVSISGTIQKLDKQSLVVEKVEFAINDQTQVTDLAGNPLSYLSLAVNSKVKISGKKQGSKILAQNIIPLNDSGLGEVEGAATSTPASSASSTPQQDQTSTPASLKTSVAATSSQEILPAPDKPRLGSFIIENPNPQYSP